MSSYWFDPMVQTAGMPGYGGGGPAMSAAQINASMGWNPNAAQFNPWANTPGGFGAQTAHYQQAAANNYGAMSLPGGFPNTPAGYAAARAANSGGIGSDAARAPSQPPMGSTFEQRWAPTPHVDPMLQGHPGGYLPQGIYDGRFAPTPAPNLSNSFAERFGAAPAYDPNSFANRFGAGGYFNPGQPSQYAPGAQMPPGFSPQYEADNPGGALPLRGPGNPFGMNPNPGS